MPNEQKDICYWNSQNFESLKAIALHLKTDHKLEPLARYCQLREQGLRQKAIDELNAFIASTKAWNKSTKRSAAIEIMEVARNFPQAHTFLTQPLIKDFIEPILAQWHNEDPNDLMPLKNLAILRQDTELLSKAISLDPNNNVIRNNLVKILLDSVGYATHHLNENLFIGNEDDVNATLKQADALVNYVSDSQIDESLKKELACLKELLNDWLEYKAAPHAGFMEWCNERNRKHKWTTAIYYKK